MLRTPNEPTLQLEGIDQQDFTKLQLVAGAFPFQIGLQKRIPGKTLQQQAPGPVGSIYVFYMVFGRHYQLVDYGGAIQIDEVVVPPIVLPGLPPTGNFWYDTFQTYTPVGLVAKFWGAGLWNGGVGICQSIIDGVIDPFAAVIFFPPPTPGGTSGGVPSPVPQPPESPDAPPVPPTDPRTQYPPGTADVVLRVVTGLANNSCTGQGTQPVAAVDVIHVRDYSGAPSFEDFFATTVVPGTVVLYRGIKVGRQADIDVGLVQGTCPGPALPARTEYSIYINTGQISQDS